MNIAGSYSLPAKEFEAQYKNHISGFRQWDQADHADEWLLFPDNIDEYLSLDEVDLSNGELYTVLTSKKAKGGQGAMVAMIQGTKHSEIEPILRKIPLAVRCEVKEITLDMAGSMEAIARNIFPDARLVTDRFHSQQVVSNAVQEIRIDYRKQAIKEENEKIAEARKWGKKNPQIVYENEDTKKQLLARSRYLLFKPKSRWTPKQTARAIILFREFPDLKNAYDLSMMFRSFYEHGKTSEDAKISLGKWYKKIEEKDIESFNSAAETIRLHETTILNYFLNRSTNASAESFNAKLKAFRSIVRGVRDRKFHLFRVAKLYA